MNRLPIFRWLRRDQGNPFRTEAYRQWHIDTIEYNLRTFPGPRRECDSPYDPRWPLNEHDERALRVVKWQKANLRGRGYTFVRGDEHDHE